MKLTESHRAQLEAFFEANAAKTPCGTLSSFIAEHKRLVGSGEIKVQKCAATNCLSRLVRGDALQFIITEVYPYANDEHLATFYRSIYSR